MNFFKHIIIRDSSVFFYLFRLISSTLHTYAQRDFDLIPAVFWLLEALSSHASMMIQSSTPVLVSAVVVVMMIVHQTTHFVVEFPRPILHSRILYEQQQTIGKNSAHWLLVWVVSLYFLLYGALAGHVLDAFYNPIMNIILLEMTTSEEDTAHTVNNDFTWLLGRRLSTRDERSGQLMNLARVARVQTHNTKSEC